MGEARERDTLFLSEVGKLGSCIRAVDATGTEDQSIFWEVREVRHGGNVSFSSSSSPSRRIHWGAWHDTLVRVITALPRGGT